MFKWIKKIFKKKMIFKQALVKMINSDQGHLSIWVKRKFKINIAKSIEKLILVLGHININTHIDIIKGKDGNIKVFRSGEKIMEIKFFRSLKRKLQSDK